MSARIFLVILAVTVGLLIAGAIVANVLESSGKLSRETIGPNGELAIQIFFFSLFIVICFTVVPLFIKLFLYMQIKIGHGELAIIKWLQAHETNVIYGLWIFMLIGFCIALQGAVKDGLFK
jgi:hypothetical protein